MGVLKFAPAERCVGLIILSTDVTPERDLVPALHRAGILTAVSKIFYANPISPRSLRAIGSRLAASADLLPPDEGLAAVAFCCTSAAVELGQFGVEQVIRSVRATADVISAASAVKEQLKAAGAQRISLFAPYRDDITLGIARHLEAEGYSVVASHSLGLDDDRAIAKIDPGAILDWVRRTGAGSADAVLVSCTALRSLEVEAAITDAIGVPAVTSNGALLAALVRRAAPQT